ncbi:hypothetical protein BDK61_4724 [Haloarcula quadrata]|uniref:Uncharacterized protein n=1 Tax=Haloarcula quadrata TaxID=182779 RepID=A0A495QQC5_9EURY|nr:hypothetical protein BDK61_4724 [Haloarcula quadrata]
MGGDPVEPQQSVTDHKAAKNKSFNTAITRIGILAN